ncbi:NACHT, LRR and PYD domains-containing protein 12-like [Chanos chanos]|uniref:NACHT, LRR and PYD domains-containing protein 12-like n=1 Tax=Chanos chanos TaxID=29144 RepID=A0A6J2WG00_CHACN|nr:NACHT, LRR and PYD domains-containing protein 12-like [Chanos chanos]
MVHSNLVEASPAEEVQCQKLCQQHSNKALDMFCKTDQIPICKECALHEHRNHKKVYAQITAVPDTSSLLQDILKAAKIKEFLSLKRHLSEEYRECFEDLLDEHDVPYVTEKMMESFGGEGALRITLHFLNSTKPLLICQEKMKVLLKERFEHVTEGIAHPGKQTYLAEIYTDLCIIEGMFSEVNNEHEVRPTEKQTIQETSMSLHDMFKSTDQNKRVKTVLTMGNAGIGKTVLVQKFILDWADGKTNQDVHFVLPVPFRDLNRKEEDCSLLQLLHDFFPVLKQLNSIEHDNIKILFILDGLDECRFPLNFQSTKRCSDIRKAISVAALLENVIQGNLLPSAQIWITSRPAAISQIPPEYVHLVTEVRGFNNDQKEKYFQMKFRDQKVAKKIVSHIKSSRSLHIMCHKPIFCWISATVLSENKVDGDQGKLPKTQTEMYTHFVLIQSCVKNQKYHGTKNKNTKELSDEDQKMILKLGRLSFKQLERGNLIFYEKDLQECGIDIAAASEYSALCTAVFREEFGMYSQRVFCFVHASVQEYLAAVYVLCSYINNGIDVFSQARDVKLFDILKTAVTKALRSKNGQFDLFIRFLLGLSLESNQQLLNGLLKRTQISSWSIQEIIKYIKEKIREEKSAERAINLFHCLNELNDNSLVGAMQTCLKSGTLSDRAFKPNQCSALAFVLLMSEEGLEQFDLREYNTSQSGRQRLLPVIRASKKAILSGCQLQAKDCETVASGLRMTNSSLRDLDLSCNNLTDDGLNYLSAGLQSPYCQLRKLRLRGCKLTHKGCAHLAQCPVKLTDLDLSDNDIQDAGVMALSLALRNPQCQLQTLGLSGCQVTEQGCSSLASALSSNPSRLRKLDLSYNHLGETGVRLFSKFTQEKLNFEFGGKLRMKPGLRKYSCQLSLDMNTANRFLILSDDKRKIIRTDQKQPYPDHPERFQLSPQVMCREGLSKQRFYWEVEWTGNGVHVGLTYKGISRDASGWGSVIGLNDKSWSIECSEKQCVVRHNKASVTIPPLHPSRRLGLYLDWPAGTLSIYRIYAYTGVLLHTIQSRFSEPLYPVFGLNFQNSEVSLCVL